MEDVVVSKRVKKLAKLGQMAILLGVGLFLFAICLAALDLMEAPERAREVLRDEYDLEKVGLSTTTWQLILAALFHFASDIVGLIMLFLSYQLFRGIRSDGVFTLDVGLRLRRIGGLLLALVPVSIISNTLGVLVLSLSNPSGQRIVRVSVDDSDVYAVIIGVLLLIVGHIMVEAVRIADENKAFV